MERNAAQTPFARHLKGWTFEELENASDALRGLRDHPGWSVLMALLGDEGLSIDEKLDNAGASLQQADYARLHGRRSGLAAPKGAIEAVLAKCDERRVQIEASVGADAGGDAE